MGRVTTPPPRGHLAALIEALDDQSDTDRAGDQLGDLKAYLKGLGVGIAAAATRVAALQLIERACRQIDDRLREVDARDRDAYLSPAERRGMELADLAHARAKDEAALAAR